MSVVKDKYRGTTEYVRVLAELVKTAEHNGLTMYQKIAFLMGLPLTGNLMGKETGQVLGEVAEDEHSQGRPLLSAVVVGTSGRPGPGFFTLARQLGKIAAGQDEDEFWRAELNHVYETWRPKTYA